MWAKKIKAIRYIRLSWAIASFLNLCFLAFYFYDILLPDGAYGVEQVLNFKTNSIPSLLPRWTLQLIPYWNPAPPWVSLGLHTLALLLYVFLPQTKIWGLVLFAFEYVLVTRIAFIGHGGQILLIFLLFFDSLIEWFPQKRRVALSLVPLYFLFFVYLLSGYHKDPKLWFETGDALQQFIRLEFSGQGKVPWELGSLGNILTRVMYLVELACPLVILFDFFSRRVNGTILLLCFLGLSLIHLGSFVLFSLFTFPMLGLSFLAYWYLGHQEMRPRTWREKLTPLLLVSAWQLVQVARLPLPPLVFPVLHRWTFFSKPAKALPGQLEFKLYGGDQLLHQTTFNESFHWTRFRFMLDETAPHYRTLRPSYARFMCHKLQAQRYQWRSPKATEEALCRTLEDLKSGSPPAH